MKKRLCYGAALAGAVFAAFTAVATAVPVAAIAPIAPEGDVRGAAMVYRVSYLGISIGKMAYSFRVSPTAYTADSQVTPGDLLRTISKKAAQSSTYTALARGRMAGDAPAPVYYRHSGGRKGRVVEVRYDGPEVVNTATPSFGNMGDPPATPEQKRAGGDALAALVGLATRAPADDPCRYTLKIFDGRTRYDIVLSPAGNEDVHVDGYRGPAAKCVAQYRRIAGYDKDDDPLFSRPVSFWLARLSNGLVVPVKIEGSSSAGGMSLSLVRLTTVDTATATSLRRKR